MNASGSDPDSETSEMEVGIMAITKRLLARSANKGSIQRRRRRRRPPFALRLRKSLTTDNGGTAPLGHWDNGYGEEESLKVKFGLNSVGKSSKLIRPLILCRKTDINQTLSQ